MDGVGVVVVGSAMVGVASSSSRFCQPLEMERGIEPRPERLIKLSFSLPNTYGARTHADKHANTSVHAQHETDTQMRLMHVMTPAILRAMSRYLALN